MAEIINLRRARKAKARADKERKAEENRAAHGVAKAERQRRAAETEAEKRRHEGHRRKPGGDGPAE